LGVNLARSAPGTPQHHGKVERCNGVTQPWAEPSACRSRSALQEQLHRECRIRREQDPSSAGRPRIAAFPGLCQGARPYRADEEDGRWDLSHGDRFLAEQVPPRRAHARGAIWL
jgi:hypothetical protein